MGEHERLRRPAMVIATARTASESVAKPAKAPVLRARRSVDESMQAEPAVGAACDPFGREVDRVIAVTRSTDSAAAAVRLADAPATWRSRSSGRPAGDAPAGLGAETKSSRVQRSSSGGARDSEPFGPHRSSSVGKIQRGTDSPIGASGGALDVETEQRIQRARGRGRTLPTGVAAAMGSAIGADLSGVRIHTDGQANRLNRRIQARAFTAGSDVFFRAGEYRPMDRNGQQLIAHELAHVVQQGGARVQLKRDRRATAGPEPDVNESSPEAVDGRGGAAAADVVPVGGPVNSGRSTARAQRLGGNRATRTVIQAKLTVGRDGDRFEQEADRVAGEVMRNLGRQPANEALPTEPAVQRQPEATSLNPLVQRKLGGALEKDTWQGLQSRLKAKGIALPFKAAQALFERATKDETVFDNIDQLIKTYELGAESQSQGQVPPANAVPEGVRSAIRSASEMAQAEAIKQVSAKQAQKIESKQTAEPKATKKHTTVKAGGAHLIINNVWLGDGQLGRVGQVQPLFVEGVRTLRQHLCPPLRRQGTHARRFGVGVRRRHSHQLDDHPRRG
jgi:hypothetical protein